MCCESQLVMLPLSSQSETSSQLRESIRENSQLQAALADADMDITARRAATLEATREISRLGLLAAGAQSQLIRVQGLLVVAEDRSIQVSDALQQEHAHATELQVCMHNRVPWYVVSGTWQKSSHLLEIDRVMN